jgi:hypothetical protein
VRADQACSSGLFAASRKYGKPTAAPRSSRIRVTGSSVPTGFHASFGAIGSVASAATRSAVWISGSSLRLAYFWSRCA